MFSHETFYYQEQSRKMKMKIYYEKTKPQSYTIHAAQKAIKLKGLNCFSTCSFYNHLVVQIFVSPKGQMYKMFMEKRIQNPAKKLR